MQEWALTRKKDFGISFITFGTQDRTQKSEGKKKPKMVQVHTHLEEINVWWTNISSLTLSPQNKTKKTRNTLKYTPHSASRLGRLQLIKNITFCKAYNYFYYQA